MRHKILVCAAILLFACSSSSPAKMQVMMDAGVDAALPAYARTLTQKALMPTSPNNLINDPLIAGDETTVHEYGQFTAYFINGSNIPLARTFQSRSPMGGAVSLEEVRDFPDGGTATAVRLRNQFRGGSGMVGASIWISAGDKSASPTPFAGAASSVKVALYDNAEHEKTVLQTSDDSPMSFGDREWVHFVTSANLSFPAGGWLVIDLTDLTRTLQLAAPEVTIQ